MTLPALCRESFKKLLHLQSRRMHFERAWPNATTTIQSVPFKSSLENQSRILPTQQAKKKQQ